MLKRYYKLLLLPFSILFLGFLSYFLIFDSLAQYKPNRVTTIIDDSEVLENLDSKKDSNKNGIESLNNGANSTPIKPLHKDKIISHTDIEFESRLSLFYRRLCKRRHLIKNFTISGNLKGRRPRRRCAHLRQLPRGVMFSLRPER